MLIVVGRADLSHILQQGENRPLGDAGHAAGRANAVSLD
jgi:hypothetical protein